MVAKSKGGAPIWEGKWRDSTGQQVKRRIGPAYLEAAPDRTNPFEGEDNAAERKVREGWRDRWEIPLTEGGREKKAPAGLIKHGDAEAELRRLVAEHEANLTVAQAEAKRAARVAEQGVPTLERVGAAWLAYAKRISGLRASSLADYRYTLGRIVDAPQFRIAPEGHEWPEERGTLGQQREVAHEWPAKPVDEITADDVEAWRDSLLDAGCSPRTVNKNRQVLANVLGWAARSKGYETVTYNVVRDVEKVREARPGRVDFYEPEEVLEIARVLRDGRWRRPARVTPKGTPRGKGRATVERERDEVERAAMALEDEQDGALVTVLAFAGLRMGEALALRWRDVNFASGKVEIWRSFTNGAEGPTKSGHERTVPMLAQTAQALARLGRRAHFTGRDDLVFCSHVGSYLDPSAFRRRYKAACKVAGLRALRVHDLRHGFLSVAARVFQPHEVQRLGGHSDVRTTARYMHAKPQPHEAERLAAAFRAGAASEAVEQKFGQVEPTSTA